ncbi:MAG TPA: hypothetical protein VG146_04040 [Verrucomicrobiae bacterium]|nr:hypothetical protein [Verrucomicrobiae bacterium]
MRHALKGLWAKAIKESADSQRAKRFLALLAATDAGRVLARVSSEQAGILASLFSGSQALSARLIKHPDWLETITPEALRFPRRKQGLRQDLDRLLVPGLKREDYAAALDAVRELNQREMLRIGARDLARLGSTWDVMQEISDLADTCLETVWDFCLLQQTQRYGRPYHQDAAGTWKETPGCILGLGKLGGQELNYSSDVDVLFVYEEEGSVFKEPPPQLSSTAAGKPNRADAKPKRIRLSQPSPQPRALLTNHQFFNRLAETFITEVTRLTAEGALYRIDLRLRPEGDAGPLSRSLPSYETYYAQWGQTWERMMLLKARGVAGDQTLAAEFLDMVQPFRYPRSINQGVLHEIGAMKDRIENEILKADELDRNVKLGRGGIREIEFIAQSQQLLHAGRQPFLQGTQTLPALKKLVQYDLLSGQNSRQLQVAYCFLRDVEHRLQMEDNRQTHTIPIDRSARERLARLMGFAALPEFEQALKAHTGHVRQIFNQALKSAAQPLCRPSPFPPGFEGAEEKWKNILAEYSFKDAGRALRMLREFVEGPGYVHVSPRTQELAFQLLPRLFGLCRRDAASNAGQGLNAAETQQKPPLSDPDRVVTRLDSFISAYGARSTLFQLWNSNPAIFELLLLLFDRSEFLAERAIRTPDLVDELVTSGRLRQRKGAEEILRDLRHGFDDADQGLWLRRYHQAELMRIGLRDILGLADPEQYLSELSALADACLQYAIEVVMRRHKIKKPPFAVIGLGKLGGAEIDYGSDLDLVFVTESSMKSPAKLAPLAIELMDLLSRHTEQGLLFHTDARLRPDGEKGLLVNGLEAYEAYYRQRAQFWEIQTLTRARAIAGNLNLGARFQQLAARLADFTHLILPLAACTPDWKKKMDAMRMRIQKERTPSGKDELAIKTGAGGLVDAEFTAQAICIERGWHEPNTLRALERAQAVGALPDAEKLIENYRKLRRVEGILRRWSYEGETVLPDEPAPFYRVSVRCGFGSSEQFRTAVADWRRAIREVYRAVFKK